MTGITGKTGANDAETSDRECDRRRLYAFTVDFRNIEQCGAMRSDGKSLKQSRGKKEPSDD